LELRRDKGWFLVAIQADNPSLTRHRCGMILGPALFIAVLFLPEHLLGAQARRVAAVTALMAVWWICESLPLAATALIPLVAFPFMKVVSAQTVASCYAAPEIFLFLGGFFIAIAMRRWHLHRRIALGIVCLVGCRGDRIVLGFMIATAFISMWVSNTATVLMMLPIALAVLATLEEHRGEGPGFDDFKMALLISVAYAASIGGIGTLIGTPPNLVFAAQTRALFPGAGEVSFIQWMAVALPFVAIFLPVAWLFVTRVALRGARMDFGDAGEAIREARGALGPMTRGEGLTLAVFALAAVAWVTRGDVAIGTHMLPGWASIGGLGSYVHDSTVAIAAAIALFAIPVDWKRGVFLLDWTAAADIPWGILLLFGGGIALGKGFIESGLAGKIAGVVSLCAGAPVVLIVILTAAVVTFLTEITSNTAVAAIMLPILASTASGLGVHPFVLMIPAAMSASCAFMLPVATPPNAIVFGTGLVSMTGMVRIGLVMNVIGVALVTLALYLFAVPVFHISLTQVPAWALP
jgi:sodium-dependent dicarboxylate transporter 2/3/5